MIELIFFLVSGLCVQLSYETEFVIDKLYFGPNSFDDSSIWWREWQLCFNESYLDLIAFKYVTSRNKSLIYIANNNISIEDMLQLSMQADICSNNVALKESNTIKEIFWQTSLALFPWNMAATKNYGFALEWIGEIDVAESLYRQCVQLSNDRGCSSNLEFLCPLPARLSSVHDIYIVFHYILKKTYTTLHSSELSIVTDDANPFNSLREIQSQYQYLGVSCGLLSVLYRKLTNFHFLTSLSYVSSYLNVNKLSLPRFDGRLRLGIVSEQEGNSSPALCFMVLWYLLHSISHVIIVNFEQKIMEYLQIHYHDKIQIIFFDR